MKKIRRIIIPIIVIIMIMAAMPVVQAVEIEELIPETSVIPDSAETEPIAEALQADETPVAEVQAAESIEADPEETTMSTMASNAEVEAFVERLYTKVLGRASDPTGKADWVNQLVTGQSTGAQVGYGFFFSGELTKRNLSDSDYIELLYATFLNRASDPAGKADWVNQAKNGLSRKGLFAGFVNSGEYDKICGSYGINRGSYSSDEPRDQNANVTAFVVRLYRLCLEREPDADGLNGWTSGLLSGQNTGIATAEGFFHSDEMITAHHRNEEYLTLAYRTLLGREPDAAGLADWTQRMKYGATKDNIFAGFVLSQEFSQICANYGISRGDIAMPTFPDIPDVPVEAKLITVDTAAVLNGFNEARTGEGFSPAGYSARLEKDAQEWALEMAKNDYQEHCPNSIYGLEQVGINNPGRFAGVTLFQHVPLSRYSTQIGVGAAQAPSGNIYYCIRTNYPPLYP